MAQEIKGRGGYSKNYQKKEDEELFNFDRQASLPPKYNGTNNTDVKPPKHFHRDNTPLPVDSNYDQIMAIEDRTNIFIIITIVFSILLLVVLAVCLYKYYLNVKSKRNDEVAKDIDEDAEVDEITDAQADDIEKQKKKKKKKSDKSKNRRKKDKAPKFESNIKKTIMDNHEMSIKQDQDDFS